MNVMFFSQYMDGCAGGSSTSSSSSSRRNTVDSNLSVLREKMELVKMRERLDKLCLHSPIQNQHGWNYATGDQLRRARTREVSSFFNLIRLVSLTFGFTCFTATSGLFLVSMIVHYLNQ